ncbi:Hypothetical_protein [Hexamita inflata]|uniref:Hypothetical_protein n=1 Tax=Hexamita inflata TaxID=28002 RepID=A0AA86PZL2_9EUKA|nr:Hypothetical protein HINF_LOCUS35471 [Hexamita inflata]
MIYIINCRVNNLQNKKKILSLLSHENVTFCPVQTHLLGHTSPYIEKQFDQIAEFQILTGPDENSPTITEQIAFALILQFKTVVVVFEYDPHRIPTRPSTQSAFIVVFINFTNPFDTWPITKPVNQEEREYNLRSVSYDQVIASVITDQTNAIQFPDTVDDQINTLNKITMRLTPQIIPAFWATLIFESKITEL